MSVLTTLISKVVPKVAGIASGGMTTIYKYAAIGGAVLALTVGAFFYGDHVGGLSQKNAVLTQANKQEIKTITIEHTQTVVDTNAVDALQKKVDQLAADKTALLLQLKNTPAPSLTNITTANGVQTCSLSKSWVDMYNQSITGVSADAAGTTP